jgi:lysozyme family protein
MSRLLDLISAFLAAFKPKPSVTISPAPVKHSGFPTVDEITDEIISREGGYVNDPDDPGGATKYGVTIHTMRRLGLDIDGDGDVDAEDVKRITKGQAASIYKEHYFKKPGIAKLPLPLQASVFDMYVNAGNNAVKILQRVLNDMGHGLSVDGSLGPKTIAAAKKSHAKIPDHIADVYGIARRNYYYDLADSRPPSRKYARRRDGGKGGWITRAEEFISPKHHLSDAQHRARVSRWG